MPGNRAIYDRAMDQSREASQQARWDDALKSAVRALNEFPQDVEARILAAVALFNTGKSSQSLQIFEELRAAEPNNPFYHEYIARNHERAGNTRAAVQSYIDMAALHSDRKMTAKVVESLRAVLRLQPDNDEQRLRLAGLLEETGAGAAAGTEYFILAQHAQAQAQFDTAAEYAEKTLRYDPNSREAKEFLMALRQTMASSINTADSLPASRADTFARSPGMTSGLRTQQVAVDKVIQQANDLQANGDIDGAIQYYERAVEAGTERSDVFYTLGLIYQERGEHQKAVDKLVRAVHDQEYALSTHFALGTSYKELGMLKEAAGEFEQTIRLVDLETIGKAEADELIQMYENAASIYSQVGDIARAASLYSTLASFLQSKRWGRDRAAEFNARAKELAERNMFDKLRTLGTGALPTMAEEEAEPAPTPEAMPSTWGKIRPITDFLRPNSNMMGNEDLMEQDPGFASAPAAPPDPLEALENLPPAQPTFAPVSKLNTKGLPEQVERWVLASERYIEQGLLEAALDACLEVINLDVEYFPIHLRIGEIYERQGRTNEALVKYQLLIDTLMVRGQSEEAINVYFRLIEHSPDTINARSRLAELLRNANRMDEAAEQMSIVASSYFRLGQTNRALEEYRRLLQWAPKSQELHTQYGQALLKLERYEAALVEFRRALELGASDGASIARLNIAMALIGEEPQMIWDSFASILGQLKGQAQNSGEVQAEYRSALLIEDHPLLHYLLAIVQQHCDQHQSALMELEQAEVLLEDASSAMLPPVLVHQAMADSYIALGQAEEALDQLRKGQAVAGRGNFTPASKHSFAVPLSRGDLVRRMAEAFAATDDLKGAEQALLEAKQLLPYDRAIYTKLADVYFRQGKLQEALTQLDDLATHYEDRQDLDKALETLEYGLRLAPSNVALNDRYANMLIRRGFLDKGVEHLMRVADLQRKANQLKDAVKSLQRAADIHWTLSQHDKAQEVYDKILHIAPNDIEARQWLSFMHTLAFRTADAIAEKKQIARIFAKQRDYDSAIAELHQIIALDQKDLEAYFMWGDMLMRREEYGQAVQLYNRMLKMEGIEVPRLEALRAAASRMLQLQQATRNAQGQQQQQQQ
jgi:tetratricopeptide (TPR) repeat protein